MLILYFLSRAQLFFTFISIGNTWILDRYEENGQVLLDHVREIHLLKMHKSGIHKEASYFGHYGFLGNHWEDKKKSILQLYCQMHPFLGLFKNDNGHKGFQLKEHTGNEHPCSLKFLENDSSHTIL